MFSISNKGVNRLDWIKGYFETNLKEFQVDWVGNPNDPNSIFNPNLKNGWSWVIEFYNFFFRFLIFVLTNITTSYISINPHKSKNIPKVQR